MSLVIRNEIPVDCTPEEAFDFLSDLRNELTWNPGMCQAVEKVSDGPIGVGTRYRARWQGSPETDVEYLEFDRPRFWRAHGGGTMTSDFRCTIRARGEGALVVTELELIPTGWYRLFFPIFKLLIRMKEDATPDRIRQALHEHVGRAKSSA